MPLPLRSVKTNAITAARRPTPRPPRMSHAATPVIPEVALAPRKRPRIPRRNIPTTGTRKNPRKRKLEYDETVSTLARVFGAGSGNWSPSIAFMIASAPASMPPAKSPSRKRGAVTSETMRLESASVSVPCVPRPVWIRILRSCLATRRRAPSSTPFLPSFHSSATRPANSSMVSFRIGGTSRTATGESLRVSISASFASMGLVWEAKSVALGSVTGAVGLGTAMGSVAAAGAVAAATKKAAAPRARRPAVSFMRPRLLRRRGSGGRRRGSRLGRKIHLRRARDGLLVLDREGRLFLVAEHHCREVGRELTREDVVFLHRLDEAVARGRDPILGAFELRLQVAEVGVALQLRIGLRDHEEAAQRAGQLALSLLEFLHRRGIVEGVGRDVHRGGAGARLRDADEHVLFLRGIALHRGDEVGNEVGAALVLVQHLRPRGLHLLILALELVVSAPGKRERREKRNGPQDIAHLVVLLKARDRATRMMRAGARDFKTRRPKSSARG